MINNRTFGAVFAFVVLVVLALPSTSHAAFSWSFISSQNGDDVGFSTTNSATYSESSSVVSPSAQACTDAAARSGLSSANDTYCVYQAFESILCLGSGYYGSGGGDSTQATCQAQANQINSTFTYNHGQWPPQSTDPILNYSSQSIALYQTPLQQKSLTTLVTTLRNYWNAYFTAQINGTAAPQAPGYSDICGDSHLDNSVPVYAQTPVRGECTVYHSVGVPHVAPIATLSANPSTVTAGSASALTYSCSNGATSASIDNGVGTVTPTAAGTVSVSPATTTSYTVTCTNAYGTGTASATVTVTPPAVNGTCGTANGTTVASAPSSGLCSAGSASSVSGSGPWTWSCTGSGGGTTASCSANKTAAPVTPTCSLTANPTNSVPSTLTWSSTNATSCTGGGFSTGNATGGSVSVGTAGTYTLSCSGTGGSCPVASVTLGGGACTNPTATISAAQTRIRAGQTTTITYAATGVSGACTVSGPGAPGAANPASCTVGSTSFSTPVLQTQATYTITCPGTTNQVIVNVVPKFIEF